MQIYILKTKKLFLSENKKIQTTWTFYQKKILSKLSKIFFLKKILENKQIVCNTIL